MNVQLDFAHTFAVELAPALPAGPGIERVFYFPGASEVGGRDGVLIRVVPQRGSSWIGCFAWGYESPLALTLVTSCPDPNRICVVSAGAGYVVRADEPRDWEKAPAFPIFESRALRDLQLLLFVAFTQLCAFGTQGLAWVSSHVSSDGVDIVGIEGNKIRLLCWSAPEGRTLSVIIDAETGKTSG